MEFDKRLIRAIFITGIAILFIILLFLIIGILTISKSNNTNKNVNILSGYSSIKELIEHYDCKYKNDTYRENRDYPTEINLVFKAIYSFLFSFVKLISDPFSFKGIVLCAPK